MTPMCSSSAIVSIHSLAVWPSGCRTQPISCEKNAPLPYGRVLGVHRRAAHQGVGPDDVEDHEQDQPGAAGVRAVEPGVAAVLLGLAYDSDDRERGDAEQHGDGEEVLQEAQRVPVADERDVEIVDEQQAEGLEVDRSRG